MPCRSDYMEPNQRERLLQETAQLYGYLLVETNQRVPGPVADAANNLYCATDFVSHLCAAIRSMDSDTLKRVVYNPYCKTSRRLADWWERHEEADRQRAELERLKARRDNRIQQAWEAATQTVWPREGDYASVSAESILKFADLLLDNTRTVR